MHDSCSMGCDELDLIGPGTFAARVCALVSVAARTMSVCDQDGAQSDAVQFNIDLWGNHLSNGTCLAHAFFKSGEQCSTLW